MTTLLTFGSFDCVHAGHASFLRRCERFADQVIVAVRSDAMFEHLRGHRPVFTFAEREALIAALGYTVHESDEAAKHLIDYLRPDVLAVGSDWADRGVLARYETDQRTLDLYGTTLIFIPYTAGISTSILKERLGG